MQGIAGNSSTKMQIILDSPVWYSGQSVSGELLVELEEPELIRRILVRVLGRGVTGWSNEDEKHKTLFDKVNPFLNEKQVVFGGDKEECHELTAGQHVFPFRCRLQTNLPSSYQGKFGRINYDVKAIIDWHPKSKYIVKQPITFLSVFDLNCLPIAAAPVSEKKCLIFWKQLTPVQMNVNLSVRGFVPGQVIPIKVSIIPESYKVRVQKIIATLYKSALFMVNHMNKHVKERLCGTEVDIENGFGLQEATLRIKVPAVPSSYLEFSDNMVIRYILAVEAKLDTFPNDIKIDTEILIGNIPLMKYEKPISARQITPELVNSEYHSDGVHLSSNDESPLSNVFFPHLALHGNFQQPIYQQETGTDTAPDLLYPVYSFADTT